MQLRLPSVAPPDAGPVIDAHTHWYPETVAEDPAGFARPRGENHWATLHAAPGSLQDWPDTSSWHRRLFDSGVTGAVVQGWYWENPATCLEENRVRRESPSGDTPQTAFLASVHPGLEPHEMVAELKRCREAGFRGIGELHPGVQGAPLDGPEWAPALRFAVEEGWPVCLHITEPLGRPHGGRVPTPLQPVLAVAERFPDLVLVLAHWGALACFHELNPYVRKRFRKVFYDTAASPLLYSPEIWRTVLSVVPPEKILFGSDFPLRLATNQPEASPVALIEEAIGQLTPEERRLILHNNAARLFGFPSERNE